MNTADHGMVEVYLKPGEVYLSSMPARVSTVLGSCISVTLFHRASGLGGICHAVLPEGRETKSRGGGLRYVDGAIGYLLEEFLKAGIRFDRLEAKLFGGAAMMVSRQRHDLSVGRQNVAVAQQVLKTSGVDISAADVGGTEGRKIVFLTHTGVVWMKRLNKSELKSIFSVD
jgi:chemotaxis protein CheD